jgi:hypothetical protein
MDNIGQIGAAIGVAIALAIVIPLIVRGQLKKLDGIEGMLREKGAMSFHEIVKQLRTNVFARGYLLQALEKRVAEGKLVKIPPPEGTPALKRFRETRYQLKG